MPVKEEGAITESLLYKILKQICFSWHRITFHILLRIWKWSSRYL